MSGVSDGKGTPGRDLIIHHLVAIDAQLRRLRGLHRKIEDGVELRARIGPLLNETCKRSHEILSLIGQVEGLQHDPAPPAGG